MPAVVAHPAGAHQKVSAAPVAEKSKKKRPLPAGLFVAVLFLALLIDFIQFLFVPFTFLWPWLIAPISSVLSFIAIIILTGCIAIFGGGFAGAFGFASVAMAEFGASPAPFFTIGILSAQYAWAGFILPLLVGILASIKGIGVFGEGGGGGIGDFFRGGGGPGGGTKGRKGTFAGGGASGKWDGTPGVGKVNAPGQTASAIADAKLASAAVGGRISPEMLLSVYQQESMSGNLKFSRSSKGALGPMQFLKGTWEEYAPRVQKITGTANVWNRRDAMVGAALYLDKYKTATGSMERALVAYNAGPGRMRQAFATLPAETQNYVQKIMPRAERYKQMLGTWEGGQLATAAPVGEASFGTVYTNAQAVPHTWDPVTDRRIQGLDPRMQQSAANFINNAESQLGIKLRITEGHRSIERQDMLYSQGRTRPGNIVTYKKGGESRHNHGIALDVAIMENGKPNFNSPITPEIANIAKSEGFSWGGDWRKFKDYPHFEMKHFDTVPAPASGQAFAAAIPAQSEMTLYEYYEKHAPVTVQDKRGYAESMAREMGVDPNAKIAKAVPQMAGSIEQSFPETAIASRPGMEIAPSDTSRSLASAIESTPMIKLSELEYAAPEKPGGVGGAVLQYTDAMRENVVQPTWIGAQKVAQNLKEDLGYLSKTETWQDIKTGTAKVADAARENAGILYNRYGGKEMVETVHAGAEQNVTQMKALAEWDKKLTSQFLDPNTGTGLAVRDIGKGVETGAKVAKEQATDTLRYLSRTETVHNAKLGARTLGENLAESAARAEKLYGVSGKEKGFGKWAWEGGAFNEAVFEGKGRVGKAITRAADKYLPWLRPYVKNGGLPLTAAGLLGGGRVVKVIKTIGGGIFGGKKVIERIAKKVLGKFLNPFEKLKNFAKIAVGVPLSGGRFAVHKLREKQEKEKQKKKAEQERIRKILSTVPKKPQQPANDGNEKLAA